MQLWLKILLKNPSAISFRKNSKARNRAESRAGPDKARAHGARIAHVTSLPCRRSVRRHVTGPRGEPGARVGARDIVPAAPPGRSDAGREKKKGLPASARRPLGSAERKKHPRRCVAAPFASGAGDSRGSS